MRHTIARTTIPAVAVLLLAGAAMAQTGSVEFRPLLAQRTVTSLLEHDGRVYAGLDGGGLAVVPAADPAAAQVWQAGGGLSGNYVTRLAWSGRNLWVGTTGAGLTRISDPGGAPAFRQYTGNLAGLDISALAGAVVGDAERVWYAVTDAGVGVITNGIAGATYTAERDGLIANRVNAIAVGADAVWFATDQGVSRFAGNVFNDANTGLGSLVVKAVAYAPDGTLTAGGNGGVYTWDAGAGAWALLGSPGHAVTRLAWVGGVLHTLGLDAQSRAVVSRWDGSAFSGVSAPYARAGALAGGADLWVGGTYGLPGMGNSSGIAWYARGDGGDGWQTWSLDDAPIVLTAEGLTFGADGTAWVGSFGGQGFSGLDGDAWTSVFELASDANDSSGLINHSGNLLAMATDTDGAVWACQYGSGGLLRHDPLSGRTDPVRTADSGLGGRGVVNLVAHPSGPLLVLHDWMDAVKVEVLVDPAAWRNPANWVDLPSGAGGLGDGPTVWDAFVERADVIWFAVESTGLVRWDVNGDAAGPGDPLTWFDPSDDRWDAPVGVFSGVANDPALARSVAAGPDGSLWCGGDGLVRFTATTTPDTMYVRVDGALLVKQSPQVEGLLGGGVYDLATDGAGDLWVVNLNGLNRVRMVDGEPEVDAWLDLMNYVGNPAYGTLYSPNVIAPLPGFVYRKVVADPGSRRVLVSGDRGAVLVTPGGSTGGGPDVLGGVFLYPNPWQPAAGAPLAVGGLDADDGEPAEVAIYNVEGQLVYRDPYVAGGVGFWSGRNRNGSPVATGMYVVRVAWRGRTALRTLAVVR